MALGVEKSGGSAVGVELAELTQFSSVSERRASSGGEYKFVARPGSARSPATDDARMVGADCELTDEPARCEPARRDELSRLIPRPSSDVYSMLLLRCRGLAPKAHLYT